MLIHRDTSVSVKVHPLLRLFFCAGLLTLSCPAQTTYYWDANSGGQGLGSGTTAGTWSTSEMRWSSIWEDGTTPVAWPNGNHASFTSHDAYTISVAGTVLVADLSIVGPANFSGGTIDFGTDPREFWINGNASRTITIGSTLTGSGAITLEGSTIAELYLTGSATLTGGLNAVKGKTTFTGVGASLTPGGTGVVNVGGGTTPSAQLHFTGGADLTDGYRIFVGTGSGPGTMKVTGAGTTVEVSQFIWLGNAGGVTGFMEITGGASVSTGTTVSVGDVTGSAGYLTVTGSTLAANGNIYISYDSYGSAIFNSGATVSTGANFYVASTPTGDADLLIDGLGTTLTIAGDLITATNHGSTTTTSTSTSNLTISNDATVTVNGTVLLADLSGAADTMTLSTGGTLIVADRSEQDGLRSGNGGSSFHLAGGTIKVRDGIGNTLTTHVPMILSHTSTLDTNDASANLSGILSGDGSLIKAGEGTLTLSADNAYTGATTIQNGTLSLMGSTQATSAIEIGPGATLALDMESPIAATNAAVTLGGAVLVTGTPVAPSYTLLAANSITGTPVLAVDIPGYQLQVVGDNELQLVQTVGTAYEIWAGGEPHDDDSNGDGIPNGIAFLLGAADPAANALALLPVINESGGSLVMNFSIRNATARGNAVLHLHHSSDLGLDDPWTAVAVPETSGTTSGVTFTITPGSPLNSVTATIASSESSNSRLFTRFESSTP